MDGRVPQKVKLLLEPARKPWTPAASMVSARACDVHGFRAGLRWGVLVHRPTRSSPPAKMRQNTVKTVIEYYENTIEYYENAIE